MLILKRICLLDAEIVLGSTDKLNSDIKSSIHMPQYIFSEVKTMDYTAVLAKELSIKPFQVENTIKLIDEGNTIPFIARYRKERTGELY